MLRILIGTICLSALFTVTPQSETDPNWRQIVPGRTTRSEAEQILGVSAESYSASYDLKEGNLFIGYSTGPCGAEKKGGWNVRKDTVIVVTFTPQKKRSLAELKINKRNLRKVVDKHTGGVTYYINARDSITYEVQAGKVDAITYEPPMKLYCGDSGLLRENNIESHPQQSVLRRLHPGPVDSEPPKGIGLLAGYKHKSETDFEGNQVGEIAKPDGLKIKYEMGLSQGMAVESGQRVAYVWYREQKVNGRVTRYALNKSNLLMISIPLSNDPNSLHVANFYGEIKKPEDIADMLLMILPYAYN